MSSVTNIISKVNLLNPEMEKFILKTPWHRDEYNTMIDIIAEMRKVAMLIKHCGKHYVLWKT